MSGASELLALVAQQVQGSLRRDGSDERPAAWSGGSTDADVAAGVRSASAPDGTRVTTTLTRYADAVALLWRTTVTGDGTGGSGLLEELRPLDVVLPVPGRAVLSSINGSRCRLDDFLPWERTLDDGSHLHVEPVGGRSSDTAAPFFVLDLDGTSLAVAIGWSGQWAFEVDRDEASVRVRAGQALARLRLRAGESITLPSVLVVAADGGADAAQNAMRRLIEAEIAPHHDDGTVVTPLAHMTMSSFHTTHLVSEASEIAAVQRTAELGLEAFWVDACWYGDTPLWAEQVGSWYVRAADFPRGLRPVSDAAHAAGLAFVFWMEPERARRGSRLVTEHPGLFLPFPDQDTDLLLDLGSDEARQVVLELVSGYVEELAVDVYRQDFNIAPLAAWRAADEPEREGLHEIRHVEGLWWLWDRLRERHPGLVIDNCASGGRRIDLETLHRAVPLWRSDAADVGGGAVGDDVSLANQRQVAGLGRFVTQHTGPVWAFDPYSLRSAAGSGWVVYCPLPEDGTAADDLRAGLVEAKRLRRLVTGDLHVLTPAFGETDGPAQDGRPESERWSVLQLHRGDLGEGAVVALRRPGSGAARLTATLSDIDPDARYRVTSSPGYAPSEPEVVDGARLAELVVEVPDAPGSLLVEYARLG